MAVLSRFSTQGVGCIQYPVVAASSCCRIGTGSLQSALCRCCCNPHGVDGCDDGPNRGCRMHCHVGQPPSLVVAFRCIMQFGHHTFLIDDSTKGQIEFESQICTSVDYAVMAVLSSAGYYVDVYRALWFCICGTCHAA